MADVFDLIFSLFSNIVEWLKSVPLSDNVSLFDFSIAITIFTIVIVAFVPVVSIGSTFIHSNYEYIGRDKADKMEYVGNSYEMNKHNYDDVVEQGLTKR